MNLENQKYYKSKSKSDKVMREKKSIFVKGYQVSIIFDIKIEKNK